MTEFLQRLKQRKLVQWAAAYAAGAWALLQVLDMASNSYGWPTLVMRLGFGVVALGFVFTLLLAWYHGERGEQKISGSVWSAFGRFLDAAGERPEAKQAYTRALEINPQQNRANFLLGNMLLADGNTDGAISHYQRAPEQFQTTGMAMAEFTRGNDAASRQSLEKMEKDSAVGFAYQIAQIYAWRGENDRAFEWLDRCFPVHDAGLVRLPFDPWLDPLRKDPRFAVLVTRMGFPK